MRRVQKVGVAVFVSLCIALLAGVAQADQICLSIIGEKTKFRDEMPVIKGCEGKIAGISFQYTVFRGVSLPDPRNWEAASTPVMAGGRTHKPVRIKKVWGSASPQLFEAMVKGEPLKSVTIEFAALDKATNQMALSHKIKLTDALIASIERQTEEAVKGQIAEVELVEFVFNKIEIIDPKHGTVTDSK